MQTNEELAPLNCWVPLSDVSDALGVNYYMMRRTVYRAHLNHEAWVKCEHYPTPGDPVCWLIDTKHATYQYHAEHWQRCARLMKAGHSTTREDRYSHTDIQITEVVESWVELCHFLSERGLVVFFNAIGDDQSWQWSWQDYTGSGYTSANAAIGAALQHRLDLDFCTAPLDALPARCTKGRPFWIRLLGKKD